MKTDVWVQRVLGEILETGGFTPEMEEKIKLLKDELDERKGMLSKYGEWYDGEDKDDFDFIEIPREDEYKSKYEDIVEKYKKRFFGGEVEDKEEIMKEQIEDVKKDDEEKTINDLFKEED